MDSQLYEKAQAASATVAPAELHGMVCGMAAGRPAEFSIGDFVQLVGTDGLTDEASIEAFVGASLAELFADDLSFALLIPDDDQPLAARVTGLADFCAGFLSGFGAGTVAHPGESAGIQSLPPDVQEILRDFASISALDETVEGDEQDESSFMELHEYARVAAVLAMTLMAAPASEADGPVRH